MYHLDKYMGVEGLSHLTFAELKSTGKLINTLTRKIHELDPRRFEDKLIEARVRLLMDLIRETLADRYQALSILAFAHILVALDHFLRVTDEKPDTLPGGFADDLQHIEQVCKQFKGEIEAFKKWQKRQPKH